MRSVALSWYSPVSSLPLGGWGHRLNSRQSGAHRSAPLRSGARQGSPRAAYDRCAPWPMPSTKKRRVSRHTLEQPLSAEPGPTTVARRKGWTDDLADP
jgi:hypothetical protein